MQIFNTLTRQKEEFVPQVPGEYRIYVCGPTVYNYIHIGNARPLIVFDTLRRYLEYRGNKVIYVSNITDIDDKLIKKGQEEGTSMKEVAQRFEAEYLKDAEGLNCKKPTVQPRATEHIQQILDIVKDLIDSGHAYVAKNGDVYFRVKSDPSYGKLSHLKLDDLESGNRELRSQMDDDLKEDPADFAVWKAAKPGEPAWESPYGMGRPGWHIECSAMSRTHLGKTIDLHCGGQDLIFPHHENEIAQSECANGCEFARYWMHNGFINVDNQKMSKSLHNFFTVRDVANLYGYEPIRYFMLTAGYRMPLNYTVDLIESCKNSLERLYTCRENLDFALSKTDFGTDETLKEKAAEARTKFCTAMDDDLNTPDALAAVFDLVKEINTLSAASSKAALETAAAAFDEITGVLGLLYNRKKDEVPAEVTALVEKRAAAKKDKDWAKKGYELAFDQLQLPVQGDLPMFKAPAGKVTLSADKHTVSGKDFSVQFDAATGELAQFTVNGKPLFKTPMAVNALRAASSNEPGVMAKSMANGLRELKHELLSYEAVDNGSSVTVKQSVKVSGKQAENISGYGDTKTSITPKKQPLNDTNTHFINNLEWTIYPDGTVVCQSVLLPRGNLSLIHI